MDNEELMQEMEVQEQFERESATIEYDDAYSIEIDYTTQSWDLHQMNVNTWSYAFIGQLNSLKLLNVILIMKLIGNLRTSYTNWNYEQLCTWNSILGDTRMLCCIPMGGT